LKHLHAIIIAVKVPKHIHLTAEQIDAVSHAIKTDPIIPELLEAIKSRVASLTSHQIETSINTFALFKRQQVLLGDKPDGVRIDPNRARRLLTGN